MPSRRTKKQQGGDLLGALGGQVGGGLGGLLGGLLGGGADAPAAGSPGGGLADMVMAQFTPDVVRAISKRLGIDESLVRMGLSVAVPLLLSALARNSQTPAGADAIAGALKRDHDGSVLARLPQSVDQYDSGPGAGILGHVLGDQRQPVQRTLTASTGADGDAVLQMAAPVVMGALGKVQRERNLDSAGVAALLQEERQRGEGGDLMRVVTGMLDGDGDGSLAGEAAGLLGRLFGGAR